MIVTDIIMIYKLVEWRFAQLLPIHMKLLISSEKIVWAWIKIMPIFLFIYKIF